MLSTTDGGTGNIQSTLTLAAVPMAQAITVLDNFPRSTDPKKMSWIYRVDLIANAHDVSDSALLAASSSCSNMQRIDITWRKGLQIILSYPSRKL